MNSGPATPHPSMTPRTHTSGVFATTTSTLNQPPGLSNAFSQLTAKKTRGRRHLRIHKGGGEGQLMSN